MFASRRESIYGPTGAFCFAGFFLFSLMIPTLAVSFFFFLNPGARYGRVMDGIPTAEHLIDMAIPTAFRETRFFST